MHAPPKPDVPIVKVEDLVNYDAYMFGIPTRYGMAPAQLKSFWDATGGLWVNRALVGKMAGLFVSTASLHGGQETTGLTFLTQLVHQGIIFVPFGYMHPGMGNLNEVHGSSPYGCGTLSGSDGSRTPSALELELAESQVRFVLLIEC